MTDENLDTDCPFGSGCPTCSAEQKKQAAIDAAVQAEREKHTAEVERLKTEIDTLKQVHGLPQRKQRLRSLMGDDAKYEQAWAWAKESVQMQMKIARTSSPLAAGILLVDTMPDATRGEALACAVVLCAAAELEQPNERRRTERD